jgi:hypothetical protein
MRLMPTLFLPTLIAFAAISGMASAADDDRSAQPQPVRDLRYGAALFSYYSEDYLQALTELLVAQQRGGIKSQGDMPALIEGSVSLSYGMDRRAETIFNQVLQRNVSDEVASQAWFYLGKVNFVRGQYPHALQLFEKSAQSDKDHALAPARAAERQYLSALIAQRNGDVGKAQQLANDIEPQPWRQYAQYNIALAQYQQNKPDAAMKTLTSLEALDGDDAETLALNERIVMTRGYVLLQQKKFADALEQYRGLSLQSPWSDRGLLGYGWAALGNGNSGLAMQAWQKLVGMPVASPSVQEGLLAIPYGYESTGANAEAVKAYEVAAGRYDEELKRLRKLREELNPQTLLGWVLENGVAGKGVREDTSWLSRGDAMALDPVNATLAELVADTAFQSALRDLLDLQRMRAQLESWQQKAPVFAYMLDARRIARDKQLKVIAGARDKFDVGALQQQRDKLAQTLDTALKQRDPWPLASSGLQQNQLRWQKAQQIAARMGNDADAAETREKLRRLGGVLRWNALEEMNDSAWAAQKELSALDAALLEMRTRKANLDQLTQRADQLEAYASRVKSAEARINAQLTVVQQMETRASQRLVTLAAEALQRQESRITQYLAYSRLAIARIYDAFYQQEGKR